MIILISGYKRSGKDTIADYVVQKYGFTRYGFADPIKEISYILFGWKKEDDERLKEVVDPLWGFSRRQFWQYFGTEWAQYQLPNHFKVFGEKIGRNFWVKKFEYLYLQNTSIPYIISDWRFPHEHTVLQQYNPVCIKVERNGCEFDGHESESYIEDLHYNYIIHNNTLLPTLYFKIDEIMKKIRY